MAWIPSQSLGIVVDTCVKVCEGVERTRARFTILYIYIYIMYTKKNIAQDHIAFIIMSIYRLSALRPDKVLHQGLSATS